MPYVLAVDDHNDSREVLCQFLARAGHEVLGVARGEDGLQRALARPPDLILLDLLMPGMSGDELLAELEARGAATPVILSSGYDAQELSERFVGRAVAGFLQKPYRLDELRAAVRKATEAALGPDRPM